MKKQLMIIGIIVILLTVGLNGCNEKSSNEENEKVNVALNTLCLKVNDLIGNYKETGKKYQTEPYTVHGFPLDEQRVLEMYTSNFTESQTSYLSQFLIRCESKEKAKNNIDILKSALKVDYPEQSIETIGEKSYFGKNTVTILGTNIDMYILFFNIRDLIVILEGMAPSQGTFIRYGKIIESNIKDAI